MWEKNTFHTAPISASFCLFNHSPEFFWNSIIQLGMVHHIHPTQTDWRRTIYWKVGILLAQRIMVLKVLTFDHHLAMCQGEKASPEMQWAVVHLSRFLPNDQIATGLNLSTHTVWRILSHFQVEGTIPHPNKEDDQDKKDEKKGNRHLCDVDVKVSIFFSLLVSTDISSQFLLGTIQKIPDLYLDELQQMLGVSCGVYVSLSTVWQTLHRAGFTMKKVHAKLQWNQQLHIQIDHTCGSRMLCPEMPWIYCKDWHVQA